MDDIVPSGPTKLWLPGLGETDIRVRRVALAVDRYDSALRLARHELTGDWCVVIGDQGHPVYGFGQELPRPEDVDQILASKDMKRHGRKLMADLAKIAERERLDAEYRFEQVDGQIAEQFEHAFRQEGRHPRPQVFVPRGI